jgi:hypothetical protein
MGLLAFAELSFCLTGRPVFDFVSPVRRSHPLTFAA